MVPRPPQRRVWFKRGFSRLPPVAEQFLVSHYKWTASPAAFEIRPSHLDPQRNAQGTRSELTGEHVRYQAESLRLLPSSLPEPQGSRAGLYGLAGGVFIHLAPFRAQSYFRATAAISP